MNSWSWAALLAITNVAWFVFSRRQAEQIERADKAYWTMAERFKKEIRELTDGFARIKETN